MTKIEQARLDTYYAVLGNSEKCLCPNRKKYMIIDGYICSGCGFDSSDIEMD